MFALAFLMFALAAYFYFIATPHHTGSEWPIALFGLFRLFGLILLVAAIFWQMWKHLP